MNIISKMNIKLSYRSKKKEWIYLTLRVGRKVALEETHFYKFLNEEIRNLDSQINY